MLGSEVVDYRVEVKELQHREGTREVLELGIKDYITDMMEASVTQRIFEQLTSVTGSYMLDVMPSCSC